MSMEGPVGLIYGLSFDGPEDDSAYDGEIRSLKNKNKISKYNCINRNRSKIAHLVCTIAVVMDIRAGLLSIEA